MNCVVIHDNSFILLFIQSERGIPNIMNNPRLLQCMHHVKCFSLSNCYVACWKKSDVSIHNLEFFSKVDNYYCCTAVILIQSVMTHTQIDVLSFLHLLSLLSLPFFVSCSFSFTAACSISSIVQRGT